MQVVKMTLRLNYESDKTCQILMLKQLLLNKNLCLKWKTPGVCEAEVRTLERKMMKVR